MRKQPGDQHLLKSPPRDYALPKWTTVASHGFELKLYMSIHHWQWWYVRQNNWVQSSFRIWKSTMQAICRPVLLSVSETLHVKKVSFSFFSEVTINKSAFPLENPLLPLNTTYRQLQVKIISLQEWLRKWRSIDFETIIMAQIYGYEIKFKIQYKDHPGFVNCDGSHFPHDETALIAGPETYLLLANHS